MARIVRGVQAAWGQGAALAVESLAAYPPARPTRPHLTAPWAQPVAEASVAAVGWIEPVSLDRPIAAPWPSTGPRLAPAWIVVTAAGLPMDRTAVLPWGLYGARLLRALVPQWAVARTSDAPARAAWGAYAPSLAAWLMPSSPAVQRDRLWWLPWTRYSRPLPVAWGIPSESGELPGQGGGVVPALRAYIVANDVTLVRVSDLAAIPAYGLQISADADSWTVGWSATVHGAALAVLEPAQPGEPVELEAAINGDVYRLLVEEIARDREFPSTRLQVAGRGISARIAAPYAAAVSRDNAGGALTAAQLMDDALTINAVPIGWTVDFGLTDWLVPAGAWRHTGSHLEAVQAIAAAAGGYVRSDRSAQTLHIRPRWPVLPWELASATPDIVLPASAVRRESVRWVERPDYNGVYVSGEAQGILAHVRRLGTQGDILAGMVTDPLITHDDAARQRGIAEIGIPGRSALQTLELQVLPSTGVIEVGTILQFQDGAANRTGIVRGVTVSYQRPRLRQLVEVETHA